MTNSIDLIDQRDTFALGVCFYPEHWPRDRDDLGFAAVNREQLGNGLCAATDRARRS